MHVLPKIADAWAAPTGGNSISTGAAGPGNGTGGMIVIGLNKIPNVMLTTYANDLKTPTEQFKNISEASIQYIIGQAPSTEYVGDYYMSMMAATANGWDPLRYSPDWVANKAAYITRDGFATQTPTTAYVCLTSPNDVVGIFSERWAIQQNNGEYTRNDYATVPIANAHGDWWWMAYLIDTCTDINKGMTPAERASSLSVLGVNDPMIQKTDKDGKPKKYIKFDSYELNFGDKSEEMGKIWASCILEGAGAYDARFCGMDCITDPMRVPPDTGLDSQGVHVNALAATCDNLSRHIASYFSKDPGIVFEQINSYYTSWPEGATTPEDSKVRLAGYNLLMLAAIARMVLWYNPQSYEDMKALMVEAWMNRNLDGCNEFIVVDGFMTAGQRSEHSAPPSLFSYPAAIQAGLGGAYSINTYNQIMREVIWDGEPYNLYRRNPNDNTPLQANMEASAEAIFTEREANLRTRVYTGKTKSSHMMVWMYNYFAKYKAGERPDGLLDYGGETQSFWTNPYCWESAIYLRDVKGNRISSLGTFMYSGPTGDGKEKAGVSHGDDSDRNGCPDPPCTETDTGTPTETETTTIICDCGYNTKKGKCYECEDDTTPTPTETTECDDCDTETDTETTSTDCTDCDITETFTCPPDDPLCEPGIIVMCPNPPCGPPTDCTDCTTETPSTETETSTECPCGYDEHRRRCIPCPTETETETTTEDCIFPPCPTPTETETTTTETETTTTTAPPPPPIPRDDSPDTSRPGISVETTPEVDELEECANTGEIEIAIQLSATDKVINDIFNYYTGILQTEPTATMKVRIDIKAVTEVGEDELEDRNYFNILAQGISDYTMTIVDDKTVALESSEFTSKDALQDFLTGSKATITLLDQNIKVCTKVVNTYYAKMHICFSGKGIDYGGEPKGEETDEDWAYDRSILYAKEFPHYYSEMRHVPYAEIKADEPYNERYEAMAGVPTTENLYFGAGATEFMVNVDLEWKTENAQRIYTITLRNEKCYGEGTACTFSCSGSGDPTHECPGPDSTCGGPGCGGDHHRNSYHPGTCVYTVTIKQDIDTYSYMDITAMELWMLNYIELRGNSAVFKPNKVKVEPGLGYYANYKHDGYETGNGRLHFNMQIDSKSTGASGDNKTALWGDTKASLKATVDGDHSTCLKNAVDAINAIIDSMTDVYVDVVSDYVVLATSEGYQHIMAHKYSSDHVSLADLEVKKEDFNATVGDEATASHSKELIAPKLTFSSGIPTQEDMWDNNGMSASNWSSSAITTTGYNGKYDEPMAKYDNNNRTRSNNNLQSIVNDECPEMEYIDYDGEFFDGSGYNPKYVITGLNILDSTNVYTLKKQLLHGTSIPLDGWKNITDNYVKYRNWSASDSVNPVVNGKQDTGMAFAKYTREIKYKTTAGKNFDKWTNTNKAVYTRGTSDINDIVVHNPISNRDAILISNDSKYDARYWGDLEPMAPPQQIVKCPRNSGCQFSHRICNRNEVHTDSCYIEVLSGYNCGFPINDHKHNSACYKNTMRFAWEGCDTHSGWAYGDTRDEAMARTGRPMGCTSGHWAMVGEPCQVVQKGSRTFRFSAPGSHCSYEGDTFTITHTGDPTEADIIAKWGSEHVHPNMVFTFLYQTDGCFGELNSHNHSATCTQGTKKVLKCTDPHHHEPGEPGDVNNPKNHYPFADTRCYEPCNDDEKHRLPTSITLPDTGAQIPTGNAFINLDRDFQIYYPDTGDFEQQPGMLGILECSKTRGKGYVNDTNTSVWVRNKFVQFPTNVIDSAGNYWYSFEYIDLNKLPLVYKDSDKKEWNDSSSKLRGLNYYTFTCVMMNAEASGAVVTFTSVATNAPEIYSYSDGNSLPYNQDRNFNCAAKMTARKVQTIDIVGSIGSLTIHDTGDPRFAELFKKPLNNGKWLIPNVVREVDYTVSNMVVSDEKDVRLEEAATSYDSNLIATGTRTNYHGTYGITNQTTGGKNNPFALLPLTSLMNPIAALRSENMRPGYNLYMDIETLGQYYGENRYPANDQMVFHQRSANGEGAYDRVMQILPTYYELDLNTGKYKPVDIYMKQGSSYVPVYLTNDNATVTEYYNYLRWLDESARRGYTSEEAKATTNVQTDNAVTIPYPYMPRVPTGDPDIIGTPKKMFLIDLDRTFIGSRYRYGVNYEHYNNMGGEKTNLKWPDSQWNQQSQRWHFTLGLPSSTVFVYAGTLPSNNTQFQRDIETIKNKDAVILCTLNIKVRGDVWTLQYDGSALNSRGIVINKGGTPTRYEPPKETDDPKRDPDDPPADPNKPVKDPVVVVYDNERTSADDMQTQGTH